VLVKGEFNDILARPSYQKAGNRRQINLGKMDLQSLLNPLPQRISEPPPIAIPRETREVARVPLAQLAQEPAPHHLSPRLARPFAAIPPKPGRKAKPIMERTGCDFAGVRKRTQHSYSREFKIEVLRWWLHHQIPQGADEREPGVLRAPFLKEVSERYLVPITTLHNWRGCQDEIVSRRKGVRRNKSGVKSCRWPELELNLYDKYRKRRDERKAVRRGWLRREAYKTFADCYPEKDPSEFPFSDGWLAGFLSRHLITLRFTTNKSQKIPEDYLQAILSWLRFNRRNSQVRSGTGDEEKVVSQYLLDSVCNLDETPLPFEYLDGQTYADKGSHSVQVKASHSGWDKRQATLLLAVFGSGRSRVQPLIIFKGKEKHEGRRAVHLQRKREEETRQYDPRVEVKWNESAYANGGLLVDWIEKSLVPALPSGPRLLALDVAKFHSTDQVLSTLRANDILPSMIPPGCTGLVQPLDVSVNKPFKIILRDILDDLLDDYEVRHQLDLRELHRLDTSAIGKRRILVTHAVAKAWEQFTSRQAYKKLVISTFRKLGLTLPIDGSCDDELSIKGIDSSLLDIGDWREGGHYDELRGNEELPALYSRLSMPVDDEPSDVALEYIDRD